MTRQDHSDMISRTVTIIRDEFIEPDQPSYVSMYQPGTKSKHSPDAIIVHADIPYDDELDIDDVVVHAIIPVSDESLLLMVNENEEFEYPAIDNIEKIPANYRWLVIPEDVFSEDDELLESLREECNNRGIGVVICYSDENYDEIYVLAEPESGAFFKDYKDSDEIMDALSEQIDRMQDMEGYEEDDSYDYYDKDE